MKNYTLKQAFTLAEILITLGIIGVISALTVPTLMNNYQQQAYVTTLHKVYNETTQAVQQVMTDNNGNTLFAAGLTSQTALNNWIKNYFKVTTDCSGDSTQCLAPNAEYIKINKDTNFMTDRTAQNYYALASGAVVRPLYDQSGNKRFNIFVDTNGKKGPNVLGRDVFFFAVYENGAIDDYKDSTTSAPLSVADRDSLFENQCYSSSSDGLWGCFGKLLNDNWEMTY